MSGRWPSNFLLTHSPGCVRVGVKRVKGNGHLTHNREIGGKGIYGGGGDTGIDYGNPYADPDGLETIDDWRCTEDCPVRRLGEQSGVLETSGTVKLGKPIKSHSSQGICYGKYNVVETMGHNDKGTCARFFFQADWSYEQIEEEELWNGR